MPRDKTGISLAALVWRGMLRARRRSFAGFVAAMLAAGVFFAAATLMTGMERALERGLDRLGADLLVAPPAYRHAVQRWLSDGKAPPVPREIPAEWEERLRSWQAAGRLVGVREIQPWDLAAGGPGQPATESGASVLLVHLERWGQPMMVLPEVEAALPEAAVVVAEQASRRVARDLQPVVRYLAVAAGVAWVGALLVTGLLSGVQVAERQAELGMLRAVGASRLTLIRLMLGEMLCLAAAGVTVGVGMGLGAVALAPRGLTGTLSRWDLTRLAATAAGATLAALVIAAAGPALRVARIDPVTAVKRG